MSETDAVLAELILKNQELDRLDMQHDDFNNESERLAEDLPRDIMVEVLKLNDIFWVQQDDIVAFLDALDVTDLKKQIQVLTSVKSAIGLVPREVYSDVDQHTQCINALNEYLNLLIEREEYEC